MKKKTVIYQVIPRWFGNANTNCVINGTIEENGCGKLNDFSPTVLKHLRDMGVTHVWYTGILRHATQTDFTQYGIPSQHPDVVKGKAGSPYAVTDYYDVHPALATEPFQRMAEWEQLIQRTHQAGMKVIMDFVPNHVARQYCSVAKPDGVKDLGSEDDENMHFSTKNNFYYCWGQPLNLNLIVQNQTYQESPAKATGNDQFSATPTSHDWYETVKLNYGIDYCDAGGRSEHFSPIPDTWSKMTDILLFWAQKGVDGFRCDMAEMVPVPFWQWAIDKVKFAHPDILFIGEVYNPSLYRQFVDAGYDYLYDKVGMYDCIRDVICGNRNASDISHQWQQTDDIKDHMLYFLENHDEQRIASDFFAGNAERGVPGMIVSTMLMKNPVMVYAGQEFGEPGMQQEGYSGRDGHTTIFDYWHVDSVYRGYFDRRRLKKEEKALCALYKRILNIANDERAVREGDTFDLMYVNPHLAHRQFAFLRKAGTEVILVVTNFADYEATVDLRIPAHAFQFLGLPERPFVATDLLSGETLEGELKADGLVRLTLPANGGLVLKLKL